MPAFRFVPRALLALGIALLANACSSSGGTATTRDTTSAEGAGDAGNAGGEGVGSSDEAGAPKSGPANLRIVTGNISSGMSSTYDAGEGIRIFQGLHPDVALVQELNYKTNSDDDLAEFVNLAFGQGYTIFREKGAQIPNAVVSRFPILDSGNWVDAQVANRSFAWAKIGVPGPHPLWAVAVHLLTTSSAKRTAEAKSLVAQLQSVVPEGDFIAVGGDFNTDGRSELCVQTFAALLDTASPYPSDQQGNAATSGPRSKPYDWVMTSPALRALQVPTVIGRSSFPAGLVFDSRVFDPLDDVAPIQKSDSGSLNMQHMPVVRDFALPK